MESSAFTMLEMLTRGQLTSKAIYIAAKLRIADYLRDGPKDIEKLAKETSTHPNSLYRFLLSETKDSIRNFALLFGLESLDLLRNYKRKSLYDGPV
jgi:hypothetical protein